MWAVVDSGVWVVAVFIAAWLRYDLDALRALSAPLIALTVAILAGLPSSELTKDSQR